MPDDIWAKAHHPVSASCARQRGDGTTTTRVPHRGWIACRIPPTANSTSQNCTAAEPHHRRTAVPYGAGRVRCGLSSALGPPRRSTTCQPTDQGGRDIRSLSTDGATPPQMLAGVLRWCGSAAVQFCDLLLAVGCWLCAMHPMPLRPCDRRCPRAVWRAVPICVRAVRRFARGRRKRTTPPALRRAPGARDIKSIERSCVWWCDY